MMGKTLLLAVAVVICCFQGPQVDASQELRESSKAYGLEDFIKYAIRMFHEADTDDGYSRRSLLSLLLPDGNSDRQVWVKTEKGIIGVAKRLTRFVLRLVTSDLVWDAIVIVLDLVPGIFPIVMVLKLVRLVIVKSIFGSMPLPGIVELIDAFTGQ